LEEERVVFDVMFEETTFVVCSVGEVVAVEIVEQDVNAFFELVAIEVVHVSLPQCPRSTLAAGTIVCAQFLFGHFMTNSHSSLAFRLKRPRGSLR
jgi:hypothetical protein